MPKQPWSEQTLKDLEILLSDLRERILHDDPYCLDDPGGSLQRELLRMETESDQLEIHILKRKLAEKL